MFGKHFEWNENTIHMIEEIGRHMPGGFFIYKAEEPQELIYANHTVIEIFGCDDLKEFQQLTGYTFRGIVHPDDYEQVASGLEDQIRQGDMDYLEYRIIRKDGTVRWVDDYGHFTETEAYGGIFYVFISDITDKHRVEERLELQEKLLEEQRQRAQQDSMIVALFSDYRSVYYVDLDKDEAVCYQEDRRFSDTPSAGEHFPYLRDFTDFATNHVAESYREGFLQFIQPDNIRRELLKVACHRLSFSGTARRDRGLFHAAYGRCPPYRGQDGSSCPRHRCRVYGY